MKEFQNRISRLKKMINYWKKESFYDYIIIEDWRVLPSSYYWKYSKETVEKLQNEELKKLRRIIQEL